MRSARPGRPGGSGELVLAEPWKLVRGAGVAVVALLVLSAALHGCAVDDASAAPGSAPGAAARATLAPSHEPTQAVAPAAELTPSVHAPVPSPASDGITRSHAVGDGTFTFAPVPGEADQGQGGAAPSPSPAPVGGERTVAVAVERGTPLAEVLRAQAQDVREEGRRQIMEAGGKKEIAMMVPVVFGVLPVTILFAMFPGLGFFQFQM